MKILVKIFLLCTVGLIAACSSKNEVLPRLSESELDQKSYAIAYSVTGQTYKDRVTKSYDIPAFISGVTNWYYNRVSMPIEQIQALTLNRLVDHKEYAYNSGIIFASAFQQKVDYLDPSCWGLLHKPSMIQGMDDAMHDLQKDKLRDDAYIQNGADQIIQLCVKTIAYDEKTSSKPIPKVTKKAVKK
nr:hypothetical protein [uncultured Haemophilus sp.]